MRAGRVLLVAAVLAVVVACAQLAPVRERVVAGVKAYCAEPYASRLLLRESVNASLAGAGASVTVRCAGDPQ